MTIKTTLFLILLTTFANSKADTVHICDDITEFAPYIYSSTTESQSGKGQLIGATKEFLDEIFITIGMQYTLKLLPWKRCLNEVEKFGKKRNYEVAADGSYSKTRSERFHITVPLYRTHEGIWYSQKQFPNGPSIQTIKDLNDFSLCGILGYNYEKLSQLGVTREISTGAHSVESALLQVDKGYCDIFIAGLEDTYGGNQAGIYKIPDSVKGLPLPQAPNPTFHLLVSKSSPRADELLAKLNQAILLLQRQGAAKKIFDKYLPNGNGL